MLPLAVGQKLFPPQNPGIYFLECMEMFFLPPPYIDLAMVISFTVACSFNIVHSI
jgi:hypothetical protein